jgi:hypothetical protein
MPPRLSPFIRLSFPQYYTMPIFVPPIQEKDLFKFLVENGGHWTLSSDNLGIERSIVFGTFKETRKFIEEVCDEAQRVRHHPEWANVRII